MSTETVVALFDLPTNYCIKEIVIQGLRNDGAFWPLISVDPDLVPEDFLQVFKVVINGHPLQSKDVPEA